MSKSGENLEKSKRKMKCIKGNPKRLKADFSEGTMESRRQPNNTFKVLRGGKTCQQRILYPAKIYFKNKGRGFPGGAVVESPPANAGDTGSSPGLGRSHMPWSGWAREPQLLSLRIWSLCSATREAAIVRGMRTAMKSGPHLPQLEKALAQKRRPKTAINK